MERSASSPEYPELERRLSRESTAQRDHDMPGQDVRINLANSAAEVLEPIAPGRQIRVELRHVSAFVPRSFKLPSTLSRLAGRFKGAQAVAEERSRKYRQVLYDVNACVNSGEVLALMGPSGSGKTSLLSIMGARTQKMMQVQGQVVFNGSPLTKRLKRQVGYVMQDDLLFDALTVYETLYYAAMLRLPRYMSEQQKLERVEAVIRALGLDTCRDTIIGGFFRKGVSGGERKRTSVGHELLINPSLLFLDEPTSGLDSTTAMHLLGVLRQLAAGGRSIITTIHQPSSRLYQQLDKLLLLSQGHVMFYGQAAAVPEFFAGLGYGVPFGTNTADWILDLASGDVAAGARDGEESRLFLIQGSETFLESNLLEGFRSGMTQEVAQVLGGLQGKGQLQDVPLAYPLAAAHKEVLQEGPAPPSPAGSDLIEDKSPGKGGFSNTFEMEEAKLGLAGGSRGALQGKSSVSVAGAEDHLWGAPYLQQVSILVKRFVRTRRFESFSFQAVMQTTVIALLVGLFWLQKGSKKTVVASRNTLGLLFFEVMYLSMRTMMTAVFTFPDVRKMMLKERASGMYRLSAFYFARMLSDIPMDFTLPTTFMIVVYFMGGLRYNVWAFLSNYGANLLTMLVAQGIGMLIGALVMNPKSATVLTSIVAMAATLTGGFFVVSLPSWISWVKYISWVYYGLGILLYVEFDGGRRTLYSCVAEGGAGQCTLMDPANPETAPGCVPITDLQESLGLVQNPSSQSEAVRNSLVLLGMLLVTRLAVYWVLRKKTRDH